MADAEEMLLGQESDYIDFEAPDIDDEEGPQGHF